MSFSSIPTTLELSQVGGIPSIQLPKLALEPVFPKNSVPSLSLSAAPAQQAVERLTFAGMKQALQRILAEKGGNNKYQEFCAFINSLPPLPESHLIPHKNGEFYSMTIPREICNLPYYCHTQSGKLPATDYLPEQEIGGPENLMVIFSPEFERGKKKYVNGDIHGDLTHLDEILEQTDFFNDPNVILVFTGDYIDRGKKSLETITQILWLQVNFPDRFIPLRGNHEHSITQICDDFFQDMGRFAFGRTDFNSAVSDAEMNFYKKLIARFPLALRSGEERRVCIAIHSSLGRSKDPSRDPYAVVWFDSQDRHNERKSVISLEVLAKCAHRNNVYIIDRGHSVPDSRKPGVVIFAYNAFEVVINSNHGTGRGSKDAFFSYQSEIYNPTMSYYKEGRFICQVPVRLYQKPLIDNFLSDFGVGLKEILETFKDITVLSELIKKYNHALKHKRKQLLALNLADEIYRLAIMKLYCAPDYIPMQIVGCVGKLSSNTAPLSKEMKDKLVGFIEKFNEQYKYPLSIKETEIRRSVLHNLVKREASLYNILDIVAHLNEVDAVWFVFQYLLNLNTELLFQVLCEIAQGSFQTITLDLKEDIISVVARQLQQRCKTGGVGISMDSLLCGLGKLDNKTQFECWDFCNQILYSMLFRQSTEDLFAVLQTVINKPFKDEVKNIISETIVGVLQERKYFEEQECSIEKLLLILTALENDRSFTVFCEELFNSYLLGISLVNMKICMQASGYQALPSSKYKDKFEVEVARRISFTFALFPVLNKQLTDLRKLIVQAPSRGDSVVVELFKLCDQVVENSCANAGKYEEVIRLAKQAYILSAKLNSSSPLLPQKENFYVSSANKALGSLLNEVMSEKEFTQFKEDNSISVTSCQLLPLSQVGIFRSVPISSNKVLCSSSVGNGMAGIGPIPSRMDDGVGGAANLISEIKLSQSPKLSSSVSFSSSTNSGGTPKANAIIDIAGSLDRLGERGIAVTYSVLFDNCEDDQGGAGLGLGGSNFSSRPGPSGPYLKPPLISQLFLDDKPEYEKTVEPEPSQLPLPVFCRS